METTSNRLDFVQVCLISFSVAQDTLFGVPCVFLEHITAASTNNIYHLVSFFWIPTD